MTEAQLFEGMQCVAMAGGLDGFAREVVAEAKTTVMQAARAGQYQTRADAIDAIAFMAGEIVNRRMIPDIDRELESEIVLPSSDDYPNPFLQLMAIDRAEAEFRAKLNARSALISKAILRAMGCKIKPDNRNSKGPQA